MWSVVTNDLLCSKHHTFFTRRRSLGAIPREHEKTISAPAVAAVTCRLNCRTKPFRLTAFLGWHSRRRRRTKTSDATPWRRPLSGILRQQATSCDGSRAEMTQLEKRTCAPPAPFTRDVSGMALHAWLNWPKDSSRETPHGQTDRHGLREFIDLF